MEQVVKSVDSSPVIDKSDSTDLGTSTPVGEYKTNEVIKGLRDYFGIVGEDKETTAIMKEIADYGFSQSEDDPLGAILKEYRRLGVHSIGDAPYVKLLTYIRALGRFERERKIIRDLTNG